MERKGGGDDDDDSIGVRARAQYRGAQGEAARVGQRKASAKSVVVRLDQARSVRRGDPASREAGSRGMVKIERGAEV